MVTGIDLLTDDYIEAPEEIEKDKVYIMDNQPDGTLDFYEVGTREVETFVKDYPQLNASHKREILEKFVN